jgi:hypothetical protein
MPKIKRELPVPKPYDLTEWESVSHFRVAGDLNAHIDQRQELKKRTPFKAGDIIYVERSRKAKIAKVVRVDLYLDHIGTEFSCLYRVVMMKPNGTFSDDTRYTLKMFPNDVFCGYKRAGKCPAEYL